MLRRATTLSALLLAALVLAATASAQLAPGETRLGGPGESAAPVPERGSPAPDGPLVPPLESAGRTSAGSSAAPGWHDGVLQQAGTIDCITGPAILGGSYVGWFGEVGVSPVVNQVYYVRVGWGITANPCTGGAYVHQEIQLPAYTQLAISGANPVRCFYKSPSQGSLQQFTNGCPQAPTGIGFYGAPSFDPPSGSAAWPTAFGALFELWIPVRSSQPLSGLITSPGCPACLFAGTWMIDGVFSPWVFPVQGVYVKQSATPPPPPSPSVDYPTPNNYSWPSVPNDWATAGFVFTAGTAGDIYTDIRQGTTGAWAVRAGPTAVGAGDWKIEQSWTGLLPGTTYSFRVCYDPAGAAGEVCGPSQAFTRPGGADTTPPSTTVAQKPPARTNKTTATFAFGSNELGATFRCNLDGAGYAPCSAPTYTGLAAGSHTLQVYARDLAGNDDPSPATYTWVVDLTKPNTTITGVAVAGRAATVRFKASEAGTFQCKLDGGAWKKCASPKKYSGLRVGSHTIRVRAVDRAGNIDPTAAAKTFRIR